MKPAEPGISIQTINVKDGYWMPTIEGMGYYWVDTSYTKHILTFQGSKVYRKILTELKYEILNAHNNMLDLEAQAEQEVMDNEKVLLQTNITLKAEQYAYALLPWYKRWFTSTPQLIPPKLSHKITSTLIKCSDRYVRLSDELKRLEKFDEECFCMVREVRHSITNDLFYSLYVRAPRGETT
jgi:hypothetical protein